MDLKRLSISELPKYSDWPSLLLGLKDSGRSFDKSKDSILREYNIDKWGKLLEYLESNPESSIYDCDRFFLGNDQTAPYYSNNDLYLNSSYIIHSEYFELVKSTLSRYLDVASHIVDIGSGYGSIPFRLFEDNRFKRMTYSLLEYTQSGLKCMNRLKLNYPTNACIDKCDFNFLDLSNLNIPSGSLFYTSWVVACLDCYPRDSLLEIISCNPSYVVHFEPIYQHWNDSSLLHLLWKKYLKLNNYNQSILPDLESYQEEGLIELINVDHSVFASNPLCPTSIIVWRPCTNVD